MAGLYTEEAVGAGGGEGDAEVEPRSTERRRVSFRAEDVRATGES